MRYSMMLVASRIAAILLVTTFVAAGAAKLIRYSNWRSALDEYRLPQALAGSIAVGVPLAELGVVALLVSLSLAAGAAASLALLALFSAAIARVATVRGRRVPCGCFGGDRSRDYRLLLARNAALCLACAVILLGGIEGSLVDSVSGSDLLPVALVTAGVAVIVALAMQMTGSLRGRVR
jgi:hypothetical protein